MPLKSDVEFAMDHKIIEARGVDVSEGGVAFETSEPLHLALTVTVDGKTMTRQARLVRVLKDDEGKFTFGLEFAD